MISSLQAGLLTFGLLVPPASDAPVVSLRQAEAASTKELASMLLEPEVASTIVASRVNECGGLCPPIDWLLRVELFSGVEEVRAGLCAARRYEVSFDVVGGEMTREGLRVSGRRPGGDDLAGVRRREEVETFRFIAPPAPSERHLRADQGCIGLDPVKGFFPVDRVDEPVTALEALARAVHKTRRDQTIPVEANCGREAACNARQALASLPLQNVRLVGRGADRPTVTCPSGSGECVYANIEASGACLPHGNTWEVTWRVRDRRATAVRLQCSFVIYH